MADIMQMIFSNAFTFSIGTWKKNCLLIQISLKFPHRGLIVKNYHDYVSNRSNDMLTQFTDSYMHHLTSMS